MAQAPDDGQEAAIADLGDGPQRQSPQVNGGQVVGAFIRTDQAGQGAGQVVDQNGHQNGTDQDHRHAVPDGFPAFPFLPFSPADAADDAAPHPETFADGVGDGGDGPGDAHGGQSQIPHLLADEKAVDDGVDAGEGEGDHGWDNVFEVVLIKHGWSS